MSDLTDEELIATRKLNGLDDDLFRENIEIGEYVRTKDGIIAKLIETMVYELNNGESVDFLEDIVKHSKQLIDLVEVGDYVNGYKVISIDYDVLDDKMECIELDLNNNYQYNFILMSQIKTILTKELYEANCYKVGGEDE